MPTTTTEIEKVGTLSPEQQGLLRNIMSQLSPEMMSQFFGQLMGPEFQQGLSGISELAGPLDEEAIRQRFTRTVSDPAMQRFQEEFVPELQSRFTAMGAGGSGEEELSLRTGAERLSTELARQEEGTFDRERELRLKAAGMLPGYLGAPAQSVAPYAQTALGTQAFQPVARQTTTEDPFEKFLAAFGGGLGGAAKFLPFLGGV